VARSCGAPDAFMAADRCRSRSSRSLRPRYPSSFCDAGPERVSQREMGGATGGCTRAWSKRRCTNCKWLSSCRSGSPAPRTNSAMPTTNSRKSRLPTLHVQSEEETGLEGVNAAGRAGTGKGEAVAPDSPRPKSRTGVTHPLSVPTQHQLAQVGRVGDAQDASKALRGHLAALVWLADALPAAVQLTKGVCNGEVICRCVCGGQARQPGTRAV
jgi:hypothetical protein